METILNRNRGKELADRIAERSGVDVRKCYQCGKCSAGCPMADSMDIMPRQLVHFLKTGQMDRVLKSKSIWLCASCHVCVDRCPHSIDIPTLMENSRMEAKKRGIIGVMEVDRFNSIFMEMIKRMGRSNEVVLEGFYNTTTGHLLQDMDKVPAMLQMKIVRPELNWITSASEVRNIVDQSKKEELRS